MSRFLLEIGSEEIPARMQAAAAAQLARRFTEACAAAGLTHTHVTADATPRRLWLIADGVADASASTSEERRGPRADAPDAALQGFLRSTGLARDQLEARDIGKGVFLFATINRQGRPAADILSEIIPQIITGFDWPKSMRWGSASASTASPRWVRPLTHLVALLDDQVVPADVHGLSTGRTSRGHRIHAPGPLEITSADTYASQLRAAKVVASSFVRRQLIANRAAELAAEAGLTVIPDEGLEIENAGLTEWPVPLLGHFDPAFLAVPREVIQLTMRTNQKYFALANADGTLAPAFIAVANLEATDGGEAILAGNQRVLSARLSDAKFFWDQDLDTVRKGGLEAFLPKLKDIVFHEKLGTVADKVDRVAKLARWLIASGAIPPSPLRGGTAAKRQGGGPALTEDIIKLADMAETAARLAKADLVSATVGEFPEVQGIAGGYLARVAGLAPEIADAILDHYKPIGQADAVPTDSITVAVSLAEKLDILCVFWSMQEKPTGSKDPFALRRSAIGLTSLIVENLLRFDISDAFLEARFFYIEQLQCQRQNEILMDLLNREESIAARIAELQAVEGAGIGHIASIWLEMQKLEGGPKLTRSQLNEIAAAYAAREAQVEHQGSNVIADDFLRFLADRLKIQQREAGVRPDIIDAVFELGGEHDLLRLLARVRALQAFVTTADGTNLVAGYKRAANILKVEDSKDGPHAATALDLASVIEPAEYALNAALDAALLTSAAAVAAEDFTAAMAALASLRAPVDQFFTDLMVNAPDPAVRRNRLALLARFRDAVHTVADFSRIEG